MNSLGLNCSRSLELARFKLTPGKSGSSAGKAELFQRETQLDYVGHAEQIVPLTEPSQASPGMRYALQE